MGPATADWDSCWCPGMGKSGLKQTAQVRGFAGELVRGVSLFDLSQRNQLEGVHGGTEPVWLAGRGRG